MTDKSQVMLAKLQALQDTFRTQLQKRLADIQAAWVILQQQSDDQQAQKQFHIQVHSLAGSAGTFGFKQLGDEARHLEEFFQQGENITLPDVSVRQKISDLLAKLHDAAAQGPDQLLATQNQQATQSAHSENDQTLVYVLDDDTMLSKEIANQLQNFGYEVQTFSNARLLSQTYAERVPQAFIADIHLAEGELEGLRIMAQINTLAEQAIPTIFISSRDDWQARLQAVRAGGSAYFNKPLDITTLIEQLDVITKRSIEDPCRVLIMDDMDLLAQHYAMVLQSAGMETAVVTEPTDLFEALSAFKPELILVDLYLPDCSGIEAAQVIRQHPTYRNLPLVYLSTESAAVPMQLDALRAGGDEFLQKPISDAHLVAAVSIRARRFRMLSDLMSRDSLTGLLNHINLKLTLEQELARARRRGGSLSFAMIDIDNFKSVNDSYGHPVGGRVIKSLARLLTQRLRNSDVIGRYGGEEVAVILFDTDLKMAAKLLDEFRERFSTVTHLHEKGEFTSSISVGVADIQTHDDMDSLINAADNALYQAKHAGRNQLVMDQAP
jgi:diguanylate cyclase (GGDEF)-like protein